MLKNMLLKNKLNLVLLIILISLLVLIRVFEDKLFYDPFLNFFKGYYQQKSIPKLNNLKLFLSFFYRYTLNTILSITIIYLLYRKLNVIRLLVVLYSVIFIILILAFFFCLYVYFIDWQVIFYIRRFIIQPLFLLLFIPAFYFQSLTTFKNDK